jgi:hybrid cluster-associated redox disulfide protein
LLPHDEARGDASRYGGMRKNALTSDMTVEQVMSRWPDSVRVFLDFRMNCVGCPIAACHSVEEASREHGIDRRAVLAKLRSAAGC